MKRLGLVFGAMAVLLTTLVVVGVLLPGRWSVERGVTLQAPPDSVFSTLRRIGSWESWMAWPDSVSLLADSTAGPGAGFRWEDPTYGSGRFVITDASAPRSLRYRVSVEDGDLEIDGRLCLEAAGEGTRITWSESGDFGWNPLLGYAALTMERNQGAQLERVLDSLRVSLER